jgi:hypothetical protein
MRILGLLIALAGNGCALLVCFEGDPCSSTSSAVTGGHGGSMSSVTAGGEGGSSMGGSGGNMTATMCGGVNCCSATLSAPCDVECQNGICAPVVVFLGSGLAKSVGVTDEAVFVAAEGSSPSLYGFPHEARALGDALFVEPLTNGDGAMARNPFQVYYAEEVASEALIHQCNAIGCGTFALPNLPRTQSMAFAQGHLWALSTTSTDVWSVNVLSEPPTAKLQWGFTGATGGNLVATESNVIWRTPGGCIRSMPTTSIQTASCVSGTQGSTWVSSFGEQVLFSVNDSSADRLRDLAFPASNVGVSGNPPFAFDERFVYVPVTSTPNPRGVTIKSRATGEVVTSFLEDQRLGDLAVYGSDFAYFSLGPSLVRWRKPLR